MATTRIETDRATDFLRNLIEVFPLGALVIDLDHRVILANRATREASGHPDPVAEGVKCHELTHFSSRPCSGDDDPCPLREVVRKKAPVTVFHTHYDIAGQARQVEVRAAPVFDEAGEVVAVIEAQIDVVADTSEVTELRQSERQCSALVEQSPALVCVLDADSRCTYVNQRSVDLLGREPDQLLGRPHLELLAEDDRERLNEVLALAACHRGRTFRATLLKLRHASGKEVELDVQVTAVPGAASRVALAVHYLPSPGR